MGSVGRQSKRQRKRETKTEANRVKQGKRDSRGSVVRQ